MVAIPVIGSMLLVNNPLCGGSLFPDVVGLMDDAGRTTTTFVVNGGVIGSRLTSRVSFDTEGWVAGLTEQRPYLLLPNRNTPWRGLLQGTMSAIYITDYSPTTLTSFTRPFTRRPCGFSIALNGGGNSQSVSPPSVACSALTQRYEVYGFHSNRYQAAITGGMQEAICPAAAPVAIGASAAPIVGLAPATGMTYRITFSGVGANVPLRARVTVTSTIVDEDGSTVPATTTFDISTAPGQGVTNFSYIFTSNFLSEGIPTVVLSNTGTQAFTASQSVTFMNACPIAEKTYTGEAISADLARWDSKCPLIFDAFGRVASGILSRQENKQTLKCVRPDSCDLKPSC